MAPVYFRVGASRNPGAVHSDFWHSGEYTEIKKLREGAAVIKAIIIEGIHLG
jgi:uncharacterized protein (DUF1330 family)